MSLFSESCRWWDCSNKTILNGLMRVGRKTIHSLSNAQRKSPSVRKGAYMLVYGKSGCFAPNRVVPQELISFCPSSNTVTEAFFIPQSSDLGNYNLENIAVLISLVQVPEGILPHFFGYVPH